MGLQERGDLRGKSQALLLLLVSDMEALRGRKRERAALFFFFLMRFVL